ncbi:deoxycytidylate deaminase [Peredibacter starrii]|uniref:dCMP deaminase family protein n=1 Tax=Peredibacter starrii TaxID=28202 RepID=A0AAX4HN85_9BACT|nr:dCMP deaminase family protein [Peredibacter starrii]WPU64658.1 dCMP deaminase family protein [Peredibacter starrii]
MDQKVNFLPVSSHLNWDEYFMFQAMMASFKSKDPNTKVGCVFVDDNNHQLSMGYNGQIAGIDETQIPWGNVKSVPLDQQKYAYVVHSEANAILHAKADLAHSRCYVTLFPCHECAKMIATVKVKEVIYLSDKYQDTVENAIAKKIFDMSGVKYREMKIRKDIVNDLFKYFETVIP